MSCVFYLFLVLFSLFLVNFVSLGSQGTVKESCMGVMDVLEESKEQLKLSKSIFVKKSYARPCRKVARSCPLLMTCTSLNLIAEVEGHEGDFIRH